MHVCACAHTHTHSHTFTHSLTLVRVPVKGSSVRTCFACYIVILGYIWSTCVITVPCLLSNSPVLHSWAQKAKFVVFFHITHLGELRNQSIRHQTLIKRNIFKTHCQDFHSVYLLSLPNSFTFFTLLFKGWLLSFQILWLLALFFLPPPAANLLVFSVIFNTFIKEWEEAIRREKI